MYGAKVDHDWGYNLKFRGPYLKFFFLTTNEIFLGPRTGTYRSKTTPWADPPNFYLPWTHWCFFFFVAPGATPWSQILKVWKCTAWGGYSWGTTPLPASFRITEIYFFDQDLPSPLTPNPNGISRSTPKNRSRNADQKFWNRSRNAVP